MHSLRKVLFALGAVATLLVWSSTSAGEIHPLLLSRLSSLREDERISVLVFMEAQADIRTLHRHHVRTAASREVRHREVIQLLQQTAAQGQKSLLDYLNERTAAGTVDGFTSYWITNCVVVRCTKDEVEKLAARSDVAELWENFRVRLIEPVPDVRGERWRLDEHLVTAGLRAIRADSVWYRLGITGAGRLLGSIDTGVQYGHPALMARWRGNFAPWSECWFNPVSAALMPVDFDSTGYSHGTHTMGTMCGLGSASGDTVGVAWGARWIASPGIIGDNFSQMANNITSSFQWMADPDGDPSTLDDVPDVVSNSWGVDGGFPGFFDCDNRWNAVIYNAEAAGVVVVFACGNSGPQSQTLGSPANIANSDYFNFAVGAVDATHSSWPYPIASFSSRGPSDCDSTAIKPEIVAPGYQVYSSSAHYGYAYLDGTSMACPHVAGTVALMREADPNLSVEMAKEILMRTARDEGDPGEDNAYGYGMLDAYAAVRAVQRGWSVLAGTVRNPNDEPLRAIIELANGRQIRADSTGEFLVYLPGDSTYALQISCWGYVTLDTALWLPARQSVTPQLVLQLHPQGMLSGQVLDEQFLPVNGAEVRVLNTPLPAQHTDANGEFAAFPLPYSQAYGPYVVRYEGQGFADTVDGIEVSAGDTTRLELRLVSPQHSPMGPDEYGYMAYDGQDSEDPAEYQWVEIERDSGGSGTRLNFTLNDQTLIVTLPFSFVYYGQTYSQLSVCCNGWIAMGVTTSTSYRNWPIPDVNGPAAMIAPFWDDFDPRLSGSISYYHDAQGGRFIVEFNCLAQVFPPNTYETFQVQLYNPVVHPTRTGDGNIVFQYKVISHPSGCTVGIENPAATTGLQYLYNDGYDAHAVPLSNCAAVRFTTGYAPGTGGAAGRVTLFPSLPMVDALVTVGARHIRTNGRGEFTLHGIPAGIYTVEAARSGYEMGRMENVPVYADSIMGGLEYVLFRLDPPFGLEAQLAGDTLVQLRWHSPFPLLASGTPGTGASDLSGAKPVEAAKQPVIKQIPGDHARVTLDEVTGFRIYRNGTILAEQVADTIYVDTLTVSGTYEYWVVTEYTGGESDTSNHVSVDFTSGVEPGGVLTVPADFALYQNYPNPFNSTTEIRFSLPRAVHVQLLVFNVLGQTGGIRLIDAVLPAGMHSVQWDGSEARGQAAASGLYICRLQAGSFVQSKKMILLR
jgi:subtilisin family serine protease